MTATKRLLVAGNHFSNALLLKPAPLPLGRSGVPRTNNKMMADFKLILKMDLSPKVFMVWSAKIFPGDYNPRPSHAVLIFAPLTIPSWVRILGARLNHD